MAEDVLSIAQRYLQRVKHAGDNQIMATCPFHPLGEVVTTTLSMSLAKGLYQCFSCGERGNLPKFLRKMGVPGALVDAQYKYLLEELDKGRARTLNLFDPAGVFSNTPLTESALGLFDQCPTSLLEAGFTMDTLRHFDVGFDERHMRVTFPLRDITGTLLGISGRTVVDEQPRYKVYAEKDYRDWGLPAHRTDKRGILWNADSLYYDLFFSNSQPDLLVVEGFKACMWVYQSGIKNVVALLGKSMSLEQKWILERLGAKVYLMLDKDSAGISGVRTIGQDLARSLSVRVCEYALQDGDFRTQPDSLTVEEIHQSVGQAPDFYKWSADHREIREPWHSIRHR